MTRKATVLPQPASTSYPIVRNKLLQRKHTASGQDVSDSKLAIPFIQPKLTVGQPNDKYEQEADRVADQVMRMSVPETVGSRIQPTQLPQIQRACSACEEEKKLQAKETPGSTPEVTPAVAARIQSLQGRGQPLSTATRNFFEPRFGQDFSNVRVHTDSASTRELNARAYTVDNNVVFAAGQYNSETNVGKQLLAHELVHVVQQKAQNLNNIVNRKKHTFTPGRPAHNHKPGHWAAVQADARSKCSTDLLDPSTYSEDNGIHCACANLSPAQVLQVAVAVKFRNKPIASKHLNHYLRGSGKEFNEDVNLKTLVNRDRTVRQKLANEISKSNKGHLFIQQGDYTDQDFRFAFGGIDRVEWEVDKASGTVDIWFIDRYDWHPVGFGYKKKPGPGDILRKTNCVHAAAVELKTLGAADYWMKGQATFPLSMFKSASPKKGSGSL
ncbi:MAG: DUF4157 domain-containing protein [Cyanobacteria bacterium P01_D01_bin.14]